MNLYLTADAIGAPTGGGIVTANELAALSSLGDTHVISREQLGECSDPWGWDLVMRSFVADLYAANCKPRLAHFYSGSSSVTVEALKEAGCKVTYTCAAHDKEISEQEHRALGLPFPYPHLTDPELWKRYSQCYRDADVLVCPSRRAAEICRRYGCENRIEVIPHGCDLPASVKPLPQTFVVGYMGSIGADKGLRYLLAAWKKLAYLDALLVLAGRDSTAPMMHALIRAFGGGCIELAGWQRNVSDFYNRISLYVQPSATEGFGLEVAEAMAHARPVLVSDGAGAADLVPESMVVPARNVDALCERIDAARKWNLAQVGHECRQLAENVTWDKVRERYAALWREVLA